MSWQATAWAKQTRGHGHGKQKMVLLMLAEAHNAKRPTPWPSQARLSQDCEIPERSLRRHLQNLELEGFITVTKKGNQFQPTVYDLHFDTLESKSEPAKVSKVNRPIRASEAANLDIVKRPISASEPVSPRLTSLLEPTVEPTNTKKEKSVKEKRVTEIDEPFRQAMRDRFGSQLSDVEERIDEALGHKNANKWTDKQAYVRGWLRRDAERKPGYRPAPPSDNDYDEAEDIKNHKDPVWRAAQGMS
jgi:hypothetical protein